jgi:hypothetical protein
MKYSPGDGGDGELKIIPNIAQFRGIKWSTVSVILPCFASLFDYLPFSRLARAARATAFFALF